jgi:hypothetical protein
VIVPRCRNYDSYKNFTILRNLILVFVSTLFLLVKVTAGLLHSDGAASGQHEGYDFIIIVMTILDLRAKDKAATRAREGYIWTAFDE